MFMDLRSYLRKLDLGPVSQKILSPLGILSMEKTMFAMVISELKSISRLKIFRKTWFLKKI